MTRPLAETVDAIFGHLDRLGRVTAGRRRPSLDPAEFRVRLADVGLSAPADLLAAYAVSDGTTTTEADLLGDIDILPGFYWLTSEEALAERAMLLEGEDWGGDWLPIAANGGGDYYAVICGPSAPPFGGVVGFIRGEPEQLVEYAGVGALFDIIETAFARGAYFLEEGYLEVDDDAFRAISADLQPGFEVSDARR